MQIAVLGIALPAAGATSGSGNARPVLGIAYASLRTRLPYRDPDDGTGAHASPNPSPTVAAAASGYQGSTALVQAYLASMVAALGKAPSAALATALRSMATAFQQLAAALPTPATTGGQATTLPPVDKRQAPPGTLPSVTVPSGTGSPSSPGPHASTTLLPLVPTPSGGLALPIVSPSSSSALTPSLANGNARPVSSSTPNLNWPDVAALTVVVGGILALLLRRQRRPQVRRDNRG